MISYIFLPYKLLAVSPWSYEIVRCSGDFINSKCAAIELRNMPIFFLSTQRFESTLRHICDGKDFYITVSEFFQPTPLILICDERMAFFFVGRIERN